MTIRNRPGWLRRVVALGLALLLIAPGLPHAAGQGDPPTDEPEVDGLPFSLPLKDPPGPSTWLYEQHFGNTTSAFNYGNVWYPAGQGMHFGIDLETRCGTPVYAIADGVVDYVDAEGFATGPHTLALSHPGTGYTSFYGHLSEQPPFVRGDRVERGQQIGVTGDPDLSCSSRPHLHLEIRNSDYTMAYNPVTLIEANWHMLSSIGPVDSDFEQNLDAPRQWMRLDDQPEIRLGGDWLNRYQNAWPPKREYRAPQETPAPRHLDPLPPDVTVTRQLVSDAEWNLGARWRANDLDALYLIDVAPEGEEAASGVYRQPLDGSGRTWVEPSPPTTVSPDGTVTVRNLGFGNMEVIRHTDGSRWEVWLGSYPAISPDGSRLLWEVYNGELLPGQSQPPGVEFWVSNLDGNLRRQVQRLAGGSSMWLDNHRLLLVKRIVWTADTQIFVLDIDSADFTPVLLGTFPYAREIQVAPGGGHIVFQMPFQEDPNASGIYLLQTQPGAVPQKLPFFGAYRWRDDQSLYTLSFDGSTDVHTLGVYDITTGEHRTLTDPDELPIRVANGDWQVSPDGTRISYVDPTDYALYLLTIEAAPPPQG